MNFLYSQLFVKPSAPTTDLNGQTLIITGSNTGLGFTAAQHIARLRPTRLILAVRTPSKGEKARQDIINSISDFDTSRTSIEVWQLDMSSYDSILAFSDRCGRELDRLDGVSLNAGIQTSTFELMEGYESTITVNVISTFLLAIALLPKLRESAHGHNITPRLSIVSSETHAWASFPEKSAPQGQSILKAMSGPSKKISQSRYMDSKLMQILVFRHLHSLLTTRAKQDEGKVIWNILNPGFCYSELGRGASKLQEVMRFFLARTQEMGGRPIAAGLVAGKGSDGMYMHDGVVDEGALSSYVKSKEGEEMGARLYEELKEIYERVRPGLTEGF
ncbi:hypothetical protein PMZ80_006104 [Knufia obscura]|uniref:NAD(P)-binding protein n=2 Tax=Knufia TaxID=430999 RepID=A0AAN8EML0_9EURO|nr:hypothetical protein PMZ80_006104 [Knufia obscura]KAK5954773.1 hypothetical protein OHC33_004499 [Knufia fluminis]